MLPMEYGRFCNNCSKIVVDFSSMSNNEILIYLAKQKNTICGRLKIEQLDPTPTLSNKLKKFLYAFALAFLPFLSFAQTSLDSNVTNNTNTKRPPSIAQPVIIKQKIGIEGYIYNTKGEVMPHAAVRILKNGKLLKSTSTNEKGYYDLKPLKTGEYELEYSAKGFKTLILTKVGLNEKRNWSLPITLNKLAPKSKVRYETRRAPDQPDEYYIMGSVAVEHYIEHPIFKSPNWHKDLINLMNLDIIK